MVRALAVDPSRHDDGGNKKAADSENNKVVTAVSSTVQLPVRTSRHLRSKCDLDMVRGMASVTVRTACSPVGAYKGVIWHAQLTMLQLKPEVKGCHATQVVPLTITSKPTFHPAVRSRTQSIGTFMA